MKATALVTAVVLLAAAPAFAEEGAPLSQQDKVSYSLGVEMGRNFKKQELEINHEMLLKGIKDGSAGGKLLIPEKELRAILSNTQNDMRKKMVLNRRQSLLENRKKAFDFMEANKAKEGVVTLRSGVQYRVLKEGTGRKPAEKDAVECSYRGTLLDGTVFDATEPGKPATLKVAQLIPGWKEALTLMPVGSKWQLFIPPPLAYGERGTAEIGPNEVLILEVELVAVQ